MKPVVWNCIKCWKEDIRGLLMKNEGRCSDCLLVNETVVQPSVERIVIIMPPVYSASYLNHKRKMDYNSIKKGTKTIPYGDGYILKEDVINLFMWQLKKTD